MIGRVEPPSPEPIQIHARCIFHRAEEIGRHWTLELPTACILTEREIKQLTAKDRFAENVQRGRWFGISVWTELHDRIAVGHDRHLIVALHVRHNQLWLTSLGRILFFPFLFGQILEECVEPLVHP